MTFSIKTLVVPALLLAGSFTLNAQISVTGRVVAGDGLPVVNASVLLLAARDSSLVKGVTSDDKGNFKIGGIRAGSYLLHFSHASYLDSMTALFDLSGGTEPKDMGTFRLKVFSSQLEDVTVTARKKPLFEQQIDRLVINVKSSPTNAGNTVLEVLEKSPGVTVNRSNGAVSLYGKDGVMVMINGKMNYMPQDAVLQLLNGINASMVERIELITVPPSKYDAGGNAGYINIVLMANPNEGLNGNYNLGMGVGQGTVPSAGINFNFRKKQLNLFGTYSYSRPAQLQEIDSYRKVTTNGLVKEAIMTSDRDPARSMHNARLGVDWNIGKKTVLGALVSGYDNKWEMAAYNEAVYKTNGAIDTSLKIDNDEVNHWRHYAANLNAQHTFKEGEDLSLNADYLNYDNQNPTNYTNQYFDGNGNWLATQNTYSTKHTVIDMLIGQVDYNKQLNQKASMQMGAKFVDNRFTNDVLVAKQVQDVWVPDPTYTANYFLNESIAAAYFSTNFRLGSNTTINGGLRYEYTITNLGSDTQKDIVDRKYGNLFPTIYFNQQLSDNHSLNLSYTRRINRPTFNQMAPFLIFFDPKTFISGNPAIQPSITDAMQLNYVLKQLVFSASYSYENNPIGRFVPETNPDDNTQVITAQNLDYTKLATVSATVPLRITKWWQSNVNLSVNWTELQGLFNKEMVKFSQTFFSINGSELFTLPRQFTFEVSGSFTSKSFILGSMLVKPYGMMNLALQKKFSRRGNTLSVGIDNVLNTFKWHSELLLPSQGIESTGYLNFMPPTFKITWNQHFGNSSLRDRRNRATGGDDVKVRVE